MNDDIKNELRNGTSVNGAIEAPKIVIHNPVVDLLEKLLTDARNGQLSSLGVIGITPQSATITAWAGGQRGDMFVGCAILSDGLLASITQPQKNQGRILRPMG